MNTTCPAATGNPDIAGLGVVVSLTVIILLPILIAFATWFLSIAVYLITFAKAAVAAVISEGNDIFPVWPERFAKCLLKPAVLPNKREKRLKRSLNYLLSMMLGLSDQVLLFGIVFIVLQIIGLTRGTMNILDFRTLANMIALCAETQIICLYTLQPVLAGVDLPLLARLQWRYLDRTLEHELEEFEILRHAPDDFQSEFMSCVRDIFRNPAGEIRQMIDSVTSATNKSAFQKGGALMLRAVGHMLIVVTLPIELLTVQNHGGLNATDGGCSARDLFRKSGQLTQGETPSLGTIVNLVEFFVLYMVQALKFVSPSTMRWFFLLVRLYYHRIRLVWQKGHVYLIFTACRLFSESPRKGTLRTAHAVVLLVELILFYSSVFWFRDVLFALTYPTVTGGVFYAASFLLMIAFSSKFSNLYTGPVVSASFTDASQNVGGEGLWTDGQILPLLMLVGTLITVLQNASGENPINTQKDGQDATTEQLPMHAAYITADNTLNVKVQNFIANVSAWDLSVPGAFYLYCIDYKLTGRKPIPGETWSHKGLRHLGLMPDPSESVADTETEDSTVSIAQEARRDIVQSILKDNGHTLFDVLGLNIGENEQFEVDVLLTPKLGHAIGELQSMMIRLRDDKVLVPEVQTMLRIFQYLAIAIAAWEHKCASKESADDQTSQD